MNLSACKKNLETYSGGPVVLNSGREAVKIAEELDRRLTALLGAAERVSRATNIAGVGGSFSADMHNLKKFISEIKNADGMK